jgi:hypothetical protein
MSLLNQSRSPLRMSTTPTDMNAGIEVGIIITPVKALARMPNAIAALRPALEI